MTFLTPLILSFSLGYLALSIILHRSSLPYRNLFKLSFATPLGLGLCSLITFWAYVVHAKQATGIAAWVTLIVIGVLLIVMLYQKQILPWKSDSLSKFRGLGKNFPLKNFSWELTSRQSILWHSLTLASLCFFLYAVILYLQIYAASLVWNIHGGWDARFIWYVKAKFFFRSPEEWQGMFSPLMSWTHPDYPLLIPGAIAWGWNWVGKELFIWPGMVSFIFGISTAFILLWHFRSSGSLWTGFVAAGFLLLMNNYGYWSYEQYADVPLCFFIVSSVVLLLQALRTRIPSFFLLAGLLSGLSAWTKNEGYVFLGWTTLIMIACLTTHSGLTWKEKRRFFLFFVGGMIVPLSAFSFQKWFLSPQGDYWGTGQGILGQLKVFGESFATSAFIGKSFIFFMFNHLHWNGLWYLFVIAILYRIAFVRGNADLPYGWACVILVALMQIGYFFVLHLSPLEIHMQVVTALDRLLLHASMPALIFTFETMTAKVSGDSHKLS